MPNFDNTALTLHNEIAAVCPIDGVSIGVMEDKATWRIDYRPEATDAQKTAAQEVLANFDAAEVRARPVPPSREAQLEERIAVLEKLLLPR